MNHPVHIWQRLWLFLFCWFAGSVSHGFAQAHMNQDGSVIRLSNPAIAATFNLASGEWEILTPEGQVLYSGMPLAKKDTPARPKAERISIPAPAVSSRKESFNNPLLPGRGLDRGSAPMRHGPKPEPPVVETKAAPLQIQTFAFSRTQTCRGPGLRIEAEAGVQGRLRLAIPDTGPWIFIEPLFAVGFNGRLDGKAFLSGDWNRCKLAVNIQTNAVLESRLESLEHNSSSQAAACVYCPDSGRVLVFGAWQDETVKKIELQPMRDASRIQFQLRWEAPNEVQPAKDVNWWFFGAFPNGPQSVKTLEPALKSRPDEGASILSAMKTALNP